MPYPITHWTDAQLPRKGELFIDHIGFFVADISGANRALTRMGFTLTPYTPQTNMADPSKPPIAVGLANQCVMLQRGYLEVLAIHQETDNPLINQHRQALAHHIGLHLLAFSTDRPEQLYKELDRKGLSPLPPVPLQRTIDTEVGKKELRFHVQRIKYGQMPEGRIQALKHLTPETLWQRHWMDHANGAYALTDILLCAENCEEVIKRYEQFTGFERSEVQGAFILVTERGRLTIAKEDWIYEHIPDILLPEPPSFVACALASDLIKTQNCLMQSGLAYHRQNGHGLWVEPQAALGGTIFFADDPSGIPWLRT